MLKPLILLFWMSMHPVHVAFISAEYSTESKGYKAFVKLYSDDFILDYNSLFKDNGQIGLSENNDFTKERIDDYFKNRIEFYAESLKIEGQVQDYDFSDGELKVNMLYRTGKKPKTFRVKCGILTKIYSDQSNFIIFKYKDFEEGFKLTSEKMEQTIEVK